MGKKKLQEKRGFTIHGRKFWFSKDQIQKELGCEPKEVDEIWEGGKKAKSDKPAKPQSAELSKQEKDVLAVMEKLGENGIGEVTSRLVSDKLGFADADKGRGRVRVLMKKLEKVGKVEIGEKEVGKRKQYTYKLKENV